MMAENYSSLAKPTVLIVEDEAPLLTLLRYNLEKQGFRVDEAADGQEALLRVAEARPDVMLLDWMLPSLSGIEVCRQLRRRTETRDLPIIMVTARTEDQDAVRALDIGADDYIAKPFAIEHVIARIRALLRRAHRPLRPSIRWGDLELQPGNPTALLGDQLVELTPKESLILEQLIRAQGAACRKEHLLDGFEDGRRVVGDDALRAHMRNLRHKLSAAGGHANLIETVYGLGYRLAAP